MSEEIKEIRSLRIIYDAYMPENNEDILLVTAKRFSKIVKDPDAFLEGFNKSYSAVSWRTFGDSILGL